MNQKTMIVLKYLKKAKKCRTNQLKANTHPTMQCGLTFAIGILNPIGKNHLIKIIELW